MSATTVLGPTLGPRTAAPRAPGWQLPSAEVEATVAALAGALRAREDELAERLAQAIAESDSVYRVQMRVGSEELLRACRDNLREVLGDLAHLGDRRAPTRAFAIATGRRRAQQGIPLENVLHAYRLGGRIIWEAILEESIGRRGEIADQLAQGAVVVWEGIDLYSSAVVDAYRRAEAEIRSRDQSRRHDLLHSLLSGTVAAGEVDFAAEALGLPQPGALRVAVADPRSGSPAHMAQLLRAADIPSEWAFLHGQLVGLIASPPGSAAVAEQLSRAPGVRAGLSPTLDSLLSAPLGHRQAELALRAIPAGESRVMELDSDLPLVLLAAAPDLAERLARQALGPLLTLRPPEGRVLLHTLGTYLEQGGSVARTAATLPCHRNTVCNRLTRVEQLTGLSVADPAQLTRLDLALRAIRLLGLEGPSAPAGRRGWGRC